MATVFCTKCGHQNPDVARFCANCGTGLATAGRGEPPVESTSTISLPQVDELGVEVEDPAVDAGSPVDGLPWGSGMLIVLRGPNAGSRFLLDKDLTTAGRHPHSDIFLDDVTVSRRHAEFYRDANSFLVRDVGSLNGTYANRDRIEQAKLTSGDEVQIGKFRLIFYAGGQSG
ncbi:MAG: FHA domain-containing protein [Frankiaceae bacterium]